MKPLLPQKLLFPIGLLLLSVGLLLKKFHLLPDFFEGFLIGLSLSIIIGSFIRKWYVKRAG